MSNILPGLAPVLALALCVGACGPSPSNRSETPAAGEPKSGGELTAAIDCWALTHGSYFLHQASPETAADLPKASSEDYRAWGNQAATLAKARGMTLEQYDALKKQHQTQLISAKERREVTPRLKRCIETVPRDMLNVDQPILTSAG